MLSRENILKLDSQAPGCVPAIESAKLAYPQKPNPKGSWKGIKSKIKTQDGMPWHYPVEKLFIGIANYLLDETFD